MLIDPLLLIGVLAVIGIVAFLLRVKWNFKGPQKSAPANDSAPQFHTSSAPPRLEKKSVPPTSLTRRERDIVRLVRRDLSNDEIARELAISKRTVEKHLENIFRKLELKSRSDLAGAPPDDKDI